MKGTTKNAKPNLNRESIYIDAGKKYTVVV